MKVNVIGKEDVNYVKNGQPVQGIRLYVTYPFASNKKDAKGIACDSPYFGSRFDAYHQAALVNVGDDVELVYNQFGKIDSVISVSPSPAPAPAAETGKK